MTEHTYILGVNVESIETKKTFNLVFEDLTDLTNFHRTYQTDPSKFPDFTDVVNRYANNKPVVSVSFQKRFSAQTNRYLATYSQTDNTLSLVPKKDEVLKGFEPLYFYVKAQFCNAQVCEVIARLVLINSKEEARDLLKRAGPKKRASYNLVNEFTRLLSNQQQKTLTFSHYTVEQVPKGLTSDGHLVYKKVNPPTLTNEYDEYIAFTVTNDGNLYDFVVSYSCKSHKDFDMITQGYFLVHHVVNKFLGAQNHEKYKLVSYEEHNQKDTKERRIVYADDYYKSFFVNVNIVKKLKGSSFVVNDNLSILVETNKQFSLVMQDLTLFAKLVESTYNQVSKNYKLTGLKPHHLKTSVSFYNDELFDVYFSDMISYELTDELWITQVAETPDFNVTHVKLDRITQKIEKKADALEKITDTAGPKRKLDDVPSDDEDVTNKESKIQNTLFVQFEHDNNIQNYFQFFDPEEYKETRRPSDLEIARQVNNRTHHSELAQDLENDNVQYWTNTFTINKIFTYDGYQELSEFPEDLDPLLAKTTSFKVEFIYNSAVKDYDIYFDGLLEYTRPPAPEPQLQEDPEQTQIDEEDVVSVQFVYVSYKLNNQDYPVVFRVEHPTIYNEPTNFNMVLSFKPFFKDIIRGLFSMEATVNEDLHIIHKNEIPPNIKPIDVDYNQFVNEYTNYKYYRVEYTANIIFVYDDLTKEFGELLTARVNTKYTRRSTYIKLLALGGQVSQNTLDEVKVIAAKIEAIAYLKTFLKTNPRGVDLKEVETIFNQTDLFKEPVEYDNLYKPYLCEEEILDVVCVPVEKSDIEEEKVVLYESKDPTPFHQELLFLQNSEYDTARYEAFTQRLEQYQRHIQQNKSFLWTQVKELEENTANVEAIQLPDSIRINELFTNTSRDDSFEEKYIIRIVVHKDNQRNVHLVKIAHDQMVLGNELLTRVSEVKNHILRLLQRFYPSSVLDLKDLSITNPFESCSTRAYHEPGDYNPIDGSYIMKQNDVLFNDYSVHIPVFDLNKIYLHVYNPLNTYDSAFFFNVENPKNVIVYATCINHVIKAAMTKTWITSYYTAYNNITLMSLENLASFTGKFIDLTGQLVIPDEPVEVPEQPVLTLQFTTKPTVTKNVPVANSVLVQEYSQTSKKQMTMTSFVTGIYKTIDDNAQYSKVGDRSNEEPYGVYYPKMAKKLGVTTLKNILAGRLLEPTKLIGYYFIVEDTLFPFDLSSFKSNLHDLQLYLQRFRGSNYSKTLARSLTNKEKIELLTSRFDYNNLVKIRAKLNFKNRGNLNATALAIAIVEYMHANPSVAETVKAEYKANEEIPEAYFTVLGLIEKILEPDFTKIVYVPAGAFKPLQTPVKNGAKRTRRIMDDDIDELGDITGQAVVLMDTGPDTELPETGESSSAASKRTKIDGPPERPQPPQELPSTETRGKKPKRELSLVKLMTWKPWSWPKDVVMEKHSIQGLDYIFCYLNEEQVQKFIDTTTIDIYQTPPSSHYIDLTGFFNYNAWKVIKAGESLEFMPENFSQDPPPKLYRIVCDIKSQENPDILRQLTLFTFNYSDYDLFGALPCEFIYWQALVLSDPTVDFGISLEDAFYDDATIYEFKPRKRYDFYKAIDLTGFYGPNRDDRPIVSPVTTPQPNHVTPEPVTPKPATDDYEEIAVEKVYGSTLITYYITETGSFFDFNKIKKLYLEVFFSDDAFRKLEDEPYPIYWKKQTSYSRVNLGGQEYLFFHSDLTTTQGKEEQNAIQNLFLFFEPAFARQLLANHPPKDYYIDITGEDVVKKPTSWEQVDYKETLQPGEKYGFFAVTDGKVSHGLYVVYTDENEFNKLLALTPRVIAIHIKYIRDGYYDDRQSRGEPDLIDQHPVTQEFIDSTSLRFITPTEAIKQVAKEQYAIDFDKVPEGTIKFKKEIRKFPELITLEPNEFKRRIGNPPNRLPPRKWPTIYSPLSSTSTSATSSPAASPSPSPLFSPSRKPSSQPASPSFPSAQPQSPFQPGSPGKRPVTFTPQSPFQPGSPGKRPVVSEPNSPKPKGDGFFYEEIYRVNNVPTYVTFSLNELGNFRNVNSILKFFKEKRFYEALPFDEIPKINWSSQCTFGSVQAGTATYDVWYSSDDEKKILSNLLILEDPAIINNLITNFPPGKYFLSLDDHAEVDSESWSVLGLDQDYGTDARYALITVADEKNNKRILVVAYWSRSPLEFDKLLLLQPKAIASLIKGCRIDYYETRGFKSGNETQTDTTPIDDFIEKTLRIVDSETRKGLTKAQLDQIKDVPKDQSVLHLPFKPVHRVFERDYERRIPPLVDIEPVVLLGRLSNYLTPLGLAVISDSESDSESDSDSDSSSGSKVGTPSAAGLFSESSPYGSPSSQTSKSVTRQKKPSFKNPPKKDAVVTETLFETQNRFSTPSKTFIAYYKSEIGEFENIAAIKAYFFEKLIKFDSFKLIKSFNWTKKSKFVKIKLAGQDYQVWSSSENETNRLENLLAFENPTALPDTFRQHPSSQFFINFADDYPSSDKLDTTKLSTKFRATAMYASISVEVFNLPKQSLIVVYKKREEFNKLLTLDPVQIAYLIQGCRDNFYNPGTYGVTGKPDPTPLDPRFFVPQSVNFSTPKVIDIKDPVKESPFKDQYIIEVPFQPESRIFNRRFDKHVPKIIELKPYELKERIFEGYKEVPLKDRYVFQDEDSDGSDNDEEVESTQSSPESFSAKRKLVADNIDLEAFEEQEEVYEGYEIVFNEEELGDETDNQYNDIEEVKFAFGEKNFYKFKPFYESPDVWKKRTNFDHLTYYEHTYLVWLSDPQTANDKYQRERRILGNIFVLTGPYEMAKKFAKYPPNKFYIDLSYQDLDEENQEEIPWDFISPENQEFAVYKSDWAHALITVNKEATKNYDEDARSIDVYYRHDQQNEVAKFEHLGAEALLRIIQYSEDLYNQDHPEYVREWPTNDAYIKEGVDANAFTDDTISIDFDGLKDTIKDQYCINFTTKVKNGPLQFDVKYTSLELFNLEPEELAKRIRPTAVKASKKPASPVPAPQPETPLPVTKKPRTDEQEIYPGRFVSFKPDELDNQTLEAIRYSFNANLYAFRKLHEPPSSWSIKDVFIDAKIGNLGNKRVYQVRTFVDENASSLTVLKNLFLLNDPGFNTKLFETYPTNDYYIDLTAPGLSWKYTSRNEKPTQKSAVSIVLVQTPAQAENEDESEDVHGLLFYHDEEDEYNVNVFTALGNEIVISVIKEARALYYKGRNDPKPLTDLIASEEIVISETLQLQRTNTEALKDQFVIDFRGLKDTEPKSKLSLLKVPLLLSLSENELLKRFDGTPKDAVPLNIEVTVVSSLQSSLTSESSPEPDSEPSSSSSSSTSIRASPSPLSPSPFAAITPLYTKETIYKDTVLSYLKSQIQPYNSISELKQAFNDKYYKFKSFGDPPAVWRKNGQFISTEVAKGVYYFVWSSDEKQLKVISNLVMLNGPESYKKYDPMLYYIDVSVGDILAKTPSPNNTWSYMNSKEARTKTGQLVVTYLTVKSKENPPKTYSVYVVYDLLNGGYGKFTALKGKPSTVIVQKSRQLFYASKDAKDAQDSLPITDDDILTKQWDSNFMSLRGIGNKDNVDRSLSQFSIDLTKPFPAGDIDNKSFIIPELLLLDPEVLTKQINLGSNATATPSSPQSVKSITAGTLAPTKPTSPKPASPVRVPQTLVTTSPPPPPPAPVKRPLTIPYSPLSKIPWLFTANHKLVVNDKKYKIWVNKDKPNLSADFKNLLAEAENVPEPNPDMYFDLSLLEGVSNSESFMFEQSTRSPQNWSSSFNRMYHTNVLRMTLPDGRALKMTVYAVDASVLTAIQSLPSYMKAHLIAFVNRVEPFVFDVETMKFSSKTPSTSEFVPPPEDFYLDATIIRFTPLPRISIKRKFFYESPALFGGDYKFYSIVAKDNLRPRLVWAKNIAQIDSYIFYGRETEYQVEERVYKPTNSSALDAYNTLFEKYVDLSIDDQALSNDFLNRWTIKTRDKKPEISVDDITKDMFFNALVSFGSSDGSNVYNCYVVSRRKSEVQKFLDLPRKVLFLITQYLNKLQTPLDPEYEKNMQVVPVNFAHFVPVDEDNKNRGKLYVDLSSVGSAKRESVYGTNDLVFDYNDVKTAIEKGTFDGLPTNDKGEKLVIRSASDVQQMPLPVIVQKQVEQRKKTLQTLLSEVPSTPAPSGPSQDDDDIIVLDDLDTRSYVVETPYTKLINQAKTTWATVDATKIKKYSEPPHLFVENSGFFVITKGERKFCVWALSEQLATLFNNNARIPTNIEYDPQEQYIDTTVHLFDVKTNLSWVPRQANTEPTFIGKIAYFNASFSYQNKTISLISKKKFEVVLLYPKEFSENRDLFERILSALDPAIRQEPNIMFNGIINTQTLPIANPYLDFTPALEKEVVKFDRFVLIDHKNQLNVNLVDRNLAWTILITASAKKQDNLSCRLYIVTNEVICRNIAQEIRKDYIRKPLTCLIKRLIPYPRSREEDSYGIQFTASDQSVDELLTYVQIN